MDLSIVIPAYNEADSIERTVADVVSGLPGEVGRYEIVIVDDGSTDDTSAVLHRIGSVDAHVRIINHTRNYGKGAALISGFQIASMDWVLFVDADNQVAITELVNFIPFTYSYDIIAGRRGQRTESYLRRVLSKGYGRLVAWLLGSGVGDVNCPFKLFRRTILDDCSLSSRGFLIDAELIGKATKKGYRIKEVMVQSRKRTGGRSSVRMRHAVETLRELWKIKGTF